MQLFHSVIKEELKSKQQANSICRSSPSVMSGDEEFQADTSFEQILHPSTCVIAAGSMIEIQRMESLNWVDLDTCSALEFVVDDDMSSHLHA